MACKTKKPKKGVRINGKITIDNVPVSRIKNMSLNDMEKYLNVLIKKYN